MSSTLRWSTGFGILLLVLFGLTSPLVLQAADELGPPSQAGDALRATKELRLNAQETKSVENAGYDTIAKIVDRAIRVLLVGGAIAFMLLILSSGYKLVFAADKQQQLGQIKTNLTTGVMGILVIAAAWWIVNLLGQALGIDIRYKI